MKRLLRTNYQLLTIVFLAFVTMVLVSYLYVSQIVQRQMLTIGEETMNTMQTSVSAGLSEAELLFSTITQEVESRLESGADNRALLAYLRATNAYYETQHDLMTDFMMVYGYLRGEMLSGSGAVPPEGYVPQERPWYIGAVEAGRGIYFAEPYVDADSGGVIISFSRQIFDGEGASCGVVAIDLNLTRITSYVSGQKIAGDGYGVLIDDGLRFTAHREAALIGRTMEEGAGGYGRLALDLAQGQPLSAQRFTDADGTDSVAFFRTIFNGWHIGIVMPRASYYAQANNLAAVLGSVGFVLMLLLSSILVRIHTEKMRSQEESRSKSTFLARMSHEMRTPLNAIMGMISLAKKSGDAGEIKGYMDKITGAANHLLGVINDCLDMSKVEAGKMELSETTFRLEELTAQVNDFMAFRLEEKHQAYAAQISGAVPRVISADRQRLAQVIINLLSNASKFTPEGGHIRLAIDAEALPDGRCLLKAVVEDDGIGIAREQQARLFSSFEQADNSISRKYGGTGLGLAISKRIVELMGGRIWIESELGAGAKFFFTARVGVGKAETDGAGGQDVADKGGGTGLFSGKRALIVDDVEINREILAALLHETGIAIDCAENGREACRMFAENPGRYDLILMDVHMPEMDGYEATRTIRAMKLPNARAIPIVAMTANVFREDIDRCLASGMNGHIGKPLEMGIAIATMKRFLFPSP